MKFYIDFFTPTARALSEVYFQLHLILKANPATNFAISFPEYELGRDSKRSSLGTVIRLLSPTEQDLREINIYRDIIVENNPSTFSDVLRVPEQVSLHATFSRSKRRTESQLRRIAKRSVAFGRASCADDTAKRLKKRIDKSNPHPCVTLKSLSTKQRFPLHIQVHASATQKTGEFCSYGLSREATVPIF